MRWKTTGLAVGSLLLLACPRSEQCAASDAGPPPDAGQALCATLPVELGVHPWASLQASAMGKNLRNVRGFHGRVYFGYGDLNANTGPIVVASYDPAAKSWANHLTLETESVERFVEIGSELWAPCSDGHGPIDGGCDLGRGDANHNWTITEFDQTIHVMDVTERVPGEILIGGSTLFSGPLSYGAMIWGSVGGAPLTRFFPDPSVSGETAGGPFMSLASLKDVTYAVTNHSVWTWSGTEWRHARGPGNDIDPVLLSDFVHPVTVAGHIVFGTFGGHLWRFDGTRTQPLGIQTFQTPTVSGFTEEPIAVFEASEGRLLAVNDQRDVLMSTDLQTFTCIGKAPPDVRGIGSLGGVVYFGRAEGRFSAYATRSW